MPGTEPTYDELLARADGPPGTSWGVWPGREVLGCLNRITPECRLRAAALVRTGDVFPLDLDPEVPDPPFFERARLQREVLWLGDIGHDERLDNFNTQSSTQWDGFRHVRSRELDFYGGVADEEHGVHFWAEHGIVTRGVLADVTRVRSIEPGEADPIDPDDVAKALDAQGVAVEHGDILLIRTGWTTWYRSLDTAARESAAGKRQSCGLVAGPRTVRFLWDLGIAAVAGDHPAMEVFPPGTGTEGIDDLEQLFMHMQLLPRLGMPIGELFDLDALADACAADGRWDFMFTSAPLRLRNGVASPPNALAIR
ncbi:MAG TPA: cyclase family protein [Acidimicrobiales bacterium]|nr:cyclase family protein [Acidimicrobiales bacterium]